MHSIVTELGCIDQRSIHRHKGAVKLQNGDEPETSCHGFTSHLGCFLWSSICLLSDGYLKYSFVFVNTAVVTTLIALCVTNAKVSKLFKCRVQNCGALHEGGNNANNMAKIRAIEWQKRFTKTFLIMMALYVCCFLPILILVYVFSFCVYVISFCINCTYAFIHLARDINSNLVRANSSMNPFVFAWRLERFRKAFVKILSCKRLIQRETMPSTAV